MFFLLSTWSYGIVRLQDVVSLITPPMRGILSSKVLSVGNPPFEELYFFLKNMHITDSCAALRDLQSRTRPGVDLWYAVFVAPTALLRSTSEVLAGARVEKRDWIKTRILKTLE